MRLCAWFYRWLPIVFGCHCREDRSFHWHGQKFPLCARCTGELAGMLVCAAAAWRYLPPAWLAAALLVPMLADGFAQLLTRYESTNPRRFVTGVLFGWGGLALVLRSMAAAVRLGAALAQTWLGAA